MTAFTNYYYKLLGIVLETLTLGRGTVGAMDKWSCFGNILFGKLWKLREYWNTQLLSICWHSFGANNSKMAH
jgi:hypothetical protein